MLRNIIASTLFVLAAFAAAPAPAQTLFEGASCKTFGRGVLETLYEVNRTRHV